MKKCFTAFLTIVAFMFMIASPVSAQSTMCSLPQATFGGSGIDNTNVVCGGFGGVTIGLTATPRYGSPAVTNNGAGTFFAQSGGYPSSPNLALWNFDWFVGGATSAGGTTASAYQYKLSFDSDPATVNGGVGSIGFPVFPYLTGFEGSENLGFNYLYAGVGLTSPTYGYFDPNATGTYSFTLGQYDWNGNLLASIGMDVVTGGDTTVTPEPVTMALMATGLVGLAGARSRKKKFLS